METNKTRDDKEVRKRLTYRQKVRQIYPSAKLDTTGRVYNFLNCWPYYIALSKIYDNPKHAWREAWHTISKECLKKLENEL